MTQDLIYLDNAATTQPLPEVSDVVRARLIEVAANPSSPHARGQATRRQIERSRNELASFLEADEESVIFTSGATESNHSVLLAAFLQGFELITTTTEHPSTRGIFRDSPERVHHLPVDEKGRIDPKDFERIALGGRKILLAVAWVNGETGVIQPIEALIAIARKYGIATLIDGSQAVGRIEYGRLPDMDFLSGSAHKMNAIPGAGFLVMNRMPFDPLFQVGGDQEFGHRAGTENVLGILALGAAAKRREESLGDDLARVKRMRDHFEATLLRLNPSAWVNGDLEHRAPGNSSITFPGLDGMAIAASCDAAGLVLSQVSACSSAKPTPSATLTAMGLSEDDAFSTLRVCFGVLNTEDEANRAAEILSTVVRRLRGSSRMAA